MAKEAPVKRKNKIFLLARFSNADLEWENLAEAERLLGAVALNAERPILKDGPSRASSLPLISPDPTIFVNVDLTTTV